jgi:hypothetical protein
MILLTLTDFTYNLSFVDSYNNGWQILVLKMVKKGV